MKLNHNTSGTLKMGGNITESKKFNMHLDGKAFKLMSDTIYTNKIGSMVRELGCNALDSMRASGRGDIPFEVHAPSMFEPYFSVKDTGLGLDHDSVMNIYTTYFQSTKDASNDSIGAFGLGSKTPFSYSDSFTLIAIYDGVKRHYGAMTNESGEPTISLLGEEKTNEHNGVEVIVSVDDDDYYDFAREIKVQYRFFDVKPTVLNSDNFQWPENKVMATYGNFKVLDNTRTFFVTIGGVGYPLDVNHMRERMEDTSPLAFFSVYAGGILEMNIGDIEVTVSRENISYSKHTIKSITDFIEKHAALIGKEVLDEVKNKNNDWERITYLNGNSNSASIMRLTKNSLGKNGTIGDKKIAIDDFNSSYLTSKYIISTRDYLVKTNKKGDEEWYYNVSKLLNEKRKYMSVEFSKGFIPDENDVYFIRDAASTPIARLREFGYEYSGNIYVFEVASPRTASDVTDKDIDHLSEMLGGATIKRISSLPKPAKNSKANYKAPVMYIGGSDSRVDSLNSGWERVYDPEEVEGGYYIVYPAYPNIPCVDHLGMALREKLLNKPIVAIKESRLGLIEGNPNFIPYSEAIEKCVEEAKINIYGNASTVEKIDMANEAFTHMKNFFESRNMSTIVKHIIHNRDKTNRIDTLMKGSNTEWFTRAVNLTYRILSYRNYMKTKFNDKLTRFEKYLVDNEVIDKKTDDVDPVLKMLKDKMPLLDENKYPLVHLINVGYSYYNDFDIKRYKHLIDYINLVDKCS